MDLGNIALKLATLLAGAGLVAAVLWARGNESAGRWFRWAYHGMTLSLVGASAWLMAAIVRHDFSYGYVINYSSRDLPGLYLVSAFWAGQSGTYLLWALFGALVGYFLLRKNSFEPAATMVAYLPTIGFMLILMLDPAGNPFVTVPNVPPDGRGLNPLLQDPWMASHPPLVFLGYVASTVPAVLALVALWKRRDEPWLGPALRWTIIAFIGLGLGIVLGGFWAYKVLGWGGYWGWDPVENASLIPWLALTALLHGLIVQRMTGALRRTNLILAMACYVLVVYATFLTRSGVLSDFSVHSFPAGSIYRILLAVLLIPIAVSLFVYLRARVPLGKDIPMRLGWPLILTIVIILFGISAGFVLIGTSWPIISSAMGKAASFGPSFYNVVSLPIYVALLTILGVAPFVGWAPPPAGRLTMRVIPAAAVAALGTTAALMLGGHGIGPLLLFFVALFGLTSNVMRFVEVGRVKMLHAGAPVAHAGFAMMFVGIVASSAWGTVQEARLPLNTPVEVLGHSLTYGGHIDGTEPQDRWRIGVVRPDGAEIPAEVHMFRIPGGRPGEENYFHRPAILRSLRGDFYIAPQGLESVGGSQQMELAQDQPIRFADGSLTFLGFRTEGMGSEHGMTVWSELLVQRNGQEETLSLPYTVTDAGTQGRPVEATLMPGLMLTLRQLSVEAKRILLVAEDRNVRPTEMLSVTASSKPLIGLLWLGTLLLGIGCLIAVVRRIKERKLTGF